MALNSDFEKAVADGRMWEVYQRLADILPIDPSLREQDEMLRYAEQNLPGLYQQHDGEQLHLSHSEWTEKYYADQMYRLSKNFSSERLALLRKMTKHRYNDTIKYRDEQERERERKRVKSQEQALDPVYVGGAVTVAGVVAVGVGIGISSTAVTVVGAVVAVGGIAVAVSGSLNK